MKRVNHILTLAAGLATIIAAPAGHAGTAVYGQLNVSVDQLDTGKDSALNLSSNASRLGVKGDIQVGGDLAALYQVETELFADTGAISGTGTDAAKYQTLASRNTFIGLQGNYGTVRFGRFDTPLKVIGRTADLFADQVGDARNITRGSYTYRFDERSNNSIDYTTPEKSGFKGTLLYSTNNDNPGVSATKDNNNAVTSIGINYAQGPVLAGLGYETDKNPAVGQEDPSALRLAGYYDITGDWRITALWQSVSGAKRDGSEDEDSYGIGVRFRNNDWIYKIQDYRLKANAGNKDANLLAVGIEYVLQKGVTLYANFAVTDSDAERVITPYKEGHSDYLAPASGDTASAISLGAIVKF